MVCFVCILSFRKLFHSECKCVQIEEVQLVLFTIVEKMEKKPVNCVSVCCYGTLLHGCQ